MTTGATGSGSESLSTADDLRERTSRLIRYLRECERLRIKRVRDVSSYRSVFWFHELPRAPEISTRAWENADDESPWLSIARPEAPKVPEPPEVCRGWYDTESLPDWSSEPCLLAERLVLPDDADEAEENEGAADETDASPPPERQTPPGPERLEEAPEVQQAWEQYLEAQWRPWQQEMQRLESVRQCYRHLFAMHQEQQRRGEQYELLVGVGTLLWKDTDDRQVRRPLLTVRASLTIDPVSAVSN